MGKLFNPVIFKIIIWRLWKRKLRFFLLFFNMTLSFIILLAFVNVAINLKNKVDQAAKISHVSHQVIVNNINYSSNYKINDLTTFKGVIKNRIISKSEFTVFKINDTLVNSEEVFVSNNREFVFDNEIKQLSYYDVTWGNGSQNFTDTGIVVSERYNNQQIKLGDKIFVESSTGQNEFTVIGILSKDAWDCVLNTRIGDGNFFIFSSQVVFNNAIAVATFEFDNLTNLNNFLTFLQQNNYLYLSDFETIKNLRFLTNILLLCCYFLGTLLAFACLLSLSTSIKASIREKEKLITMLYNIGLEKHKIQRLFFLELLIVGTISFFSSIILMTIIALSMKQLTNISFLDIQFNDILLPNFLATFSSFAIILLLLLLVYIMPIRKMAIKKPGEV